MKNKFWAMLLAVVMAVGLLPGTVLAAEADIKPGITTNLKDDELLHIPEAAFILRGWTERQRALYKSSPEFFTTNYCYEMPLGVTLTIGALSRRSDDIIISAWSASGGVYDLRLTVAGAADGDLTLVPSSELGPIVLRPGEKYTAGFCIGPAWESTSARITGRYSRTWTIAGPAAITTDYLTEVFGANTFIQIDVAIEEDAATGEKTYDHFYFLLTGKEIDPELLKDPAESGEPENPAGPEIPEITFSDVPAGAYYFEAVSWAVGKGLIVGHDDGTFKPRDVLTRGGTLLLLGKLAGADVEGGSPWYQKAVDWAVAGDYSDGTDPTGSTTREQLFTLLWNYEGQPDADVSVLNGFSDSGAIHSWAVNAMAWAVESGIISGDGSGRLTPQDDATRAEAVTLFMHYCEKTGK